MSATRFDYDEGFDEFASFYSDGALSDSECSRSIGTEKALDELHDIIDLLPEECIADVLALVRNYAESF